MGVETLVQGGAVGISISLVILIGKIWSDSTKHAMKMTDVVEKNATAIVSLKESIKENTNVTRETKDLINNMNCEKDKEHAS
ncbi:MAG: hypothetical protein HYW45_04295 [Candidatus Daviesbacteria bacterium]|nr:MAG: hypothetical protein HYW45_04295 [Candidatus Daviesbacteria bacterium]